MGEDHWGRTKRAQRNSFGRRGLIKLGVVLPSLWDLGPFTRGHGVSWSPCCVKGMEMSWRPGRGWGGWQEKSNHTDICSSSAPCCTRTGRQWPKEHSAAPIPATCDARSLHWCKELSALPEVSTIMSPLEGPLPHPQPLISAFPSIQYPVPTQGVSST